MKMNHANIILVFVALMGMTSALKLPIITKFIPDCPVDVVDAYFPHETDCTLYYVCSYGKVTLQRCPGALHFNPIAKICDYPELAGCQSSSTTSEIPSTEDTSTPDITTEDLTPTNPNTESPIPTDTTEGPISTDLTTDAVIPTDTTEGPISTDLTTDGVIPTDTTEGPISTDLTTDGVIPTDTTEGPISTDLTTDGVIPTDTTEGPIPTDTTTIGSDSTTGGSPTTPRPTCENTNMAFAPHETDCTKFYGCVGENPILYSCPDGKEFSYEDQNCVPISDTGCIASQPTTTEKPSTTTIPSAPTCENSSMAFVPHETDCTKFYGCVGENSILYTCPEGKEFSYADQACVLISEYGCTATKPTFRI